ncbi:MAG TPA: PEP-CTERM sorting domain-containing protein, partial [Tepidisphaeraceae bacterium]|nr:PEP-CTERM sorting domain-containing protein [Tepidisphaeraceae bacterium]
ATVLYDNVPVGAETIFTTGSTPRTGGADEVLFAGTAAKITSMQVGYSVATGGPAAFDLRVRVWDDIDFAATTAASEQFTNLASDFTLSFTDQVAGAFITGAIDLTSLPGGGVDVNANPVNLEVADIIDAYIELQFLQPGTNTPVAGNLVTYIFDGSGVNTGFTYASPAVGGDGTAAQELYWRDANGNVAINGDEARSINGNRANFVLHLEGDLMNVPEPTSLGLLGLGTLLLGSRRRA